MILRVFREAVRVWVEANIADFNEVVSHGGIFNLNELKKYSRKSPFCAVTVMATKPMDDLSSPVQVVLYVVTKDQGQERERSDIALDLVSSLLSKLPAAEFNFPAAETFPLKTSSKNLYTRDADNANFAIWAVSFFCNVDMDDFDSDALEELMTIYMDVADERE